MDSNDEKYKRGAEALVDALRGIFDPSDPSILLILQSLFIRTALQSKYWIYGSSLKIWRTREEFAEQYENNMLHLKGEWQQRFKLCIPENGWLRLRYW